jgi:hypothetical protein
MTKEEFSAIFISEGFTNEKFIDCFWKARHQLKTINETNIRIGIQVILKDMYPEGVRE